ncbi:MAG: tetratricopeptide repeat protein, partial [Planctomycetaceae bacterium]|nr:tetratricopeptide repeat protein [Planctomycetaceae bacterium]
AEAERAMDSTATALRVLLEKAERYMLLKPDAATTRRDLLTGVLTSLERIDEFGQKSPELTYIQALALHRIAYLDLYGTTGAISTGATEEEFESAIMRFNRAETLFQEVCRSRTLDFQVQKEHCYNQLRLGDIARIQERFDEAESHFITALQISAEIEQKFPDEIEAATMQIYQLTWFAKLYGQSGRFSDAKMQAESAVAAAKRLLEKRPDWETRLYQVSGSAHIFMSESCADLKEFGPALVHAHRALSFRQKHLALSPTDYARQSSFLSAQIWLAELEMKAGSFENGKAAWDEYFTAFERYRLGNTASWKVRISRAECQYRTEEFEEAEKTLLHYANSIGENYQKSPTVTKIVDLQFVVGHLINLYTTWGKPGQAAEWKAKADQLRAEAASTPSEGTGGSTNPDRIPKTDDMTPTEASAVDSQ